MTEHQKEILNALLKGESKPSVLAKKLGISRQSLHKNLKKLTELDEIEKNGSAPHVTYSLKKKVSESLF